MSTPNRRIRRRRVAERDRKRAPRACDRCKNRKQSCVETPSGICQRCLRGPFTCRFERAKSPLEDEEDVASQFDQGQRGRVTTRLNPDDGSMNPTADGDASQSPQTARFNHSMLDNSRPVPENMHLAVSPEGATTEMFMWPRFLSKLRYAFHLDSSPGDNNGGQDDQGRGGYAQHQNGIHPQPVASQEQLDRLERAIRRFPPKAVADFLVSVCITHGTDVFYYFDQAGFQSELDQLYRDSQSPLRRDPAFVGLVLATFALGSQWTTLTKPNNAHEAAAASPAGRSDPGRIFYTMLRDLMGDLLDRACIRSVQVAFMLGVYLMPASAIGTSYVYMGIALRKALAIGLHQEADDPALGNEEREARRRLFWAIWSLERTVTIKLNKPRSISQDIISVRLPTPTAADTKQKFNNVHHQIANLQLTQIMDTLAQPAAWSSDTQLPPDNYEARLKSWKRALPPSLEFETADPRSSTYRACFHLYLNYYFAWIALGKVSVVTIVRSRLQKMQDTSSPLEQIDERVERLGHFCTKAANKMLNLFEHLVRTGNLTRFSFTDFQGCSIATIVVLLAGILSREGGYQRRVEFGLDCLRKMAGENMTARTGVSFVEALKSITDEAHAKLQGSPDQRTKTMPVSSSEHQASEYAQWADWLASAERPQNGHGPLPALRNGPDAVPLAAPPETTTAWEEMAALQLQGLSATAFGHPGPSNSDALVTQSVPGMDPYLPSSVFNDDQFYLMGLTGMDVLDFTSGF